MNAHERQQIMAELEQIAVCAGVFDDVDTQTGGVPRTLNTNPTIDQDQIPTAEDIIDTAIAIKALLEMKQSGNTETRSLREVAKEFGVDLDN